MKRIYHTWNKWECYPAGFYEDTCPGGLSQAQGEEVYRAFLADLHQFDAALAGVLLEWSNSCEHYLSNENMNRIAWLGQAAVCYAKSIPNCCRGGFNRLTEEQQKAADALALGYLNKWLVSRGEEPLTEETAKSRTQANIY